ncbi:MAG: hypothetical protein FJ303_10315 [Planctomycetes bacterium]|nr:hypothetical protein [Planctomycetota bacterium]
MTPIRRVLLLWLFMFWQGGFLFYGAVVVTIGSTVLESDFAQGLITRYVAVALNITGGVVLLAWTWDLISERHSRLTLRWSAWTMLLASVIALACIHPNMDALIDAHRKTLHDADRFHHLHRWYLRISTAQWLTSVVFTWWTVQNWRESDSEAGSEPRAKAGEGNEKSG